LRVRRRGRGPAQSKREAHSALGTMSPTLLRAFDVRHDGTLLGEGAGFLVLEGPETERRPLAWLLGAGSANDATAMTAPDREAAWSAWPSTVACGRGVGRGADRRAQRSWLGNRADDETECRAFGQVFRGQERPVVFATKGNFGHSSARPAPWKRSRGGPGPARPGGAAHRRTRAACSGMPAPPGAGHAGAFFRPLRFSLTLGFGGFNTSLVFGACL